MLECHAGGSVAVYPKDSAHHLSCTNRYLSPLRAGEVIPSAAFCRDSDSRYARLEAAVASGPLSRDDLEALLGSMDSDSVLTSGQQPLAGECISSPLTVQSVVMEPELAQVRVSVGAAPTGLGPYVTVPWEWSDSPGVSEIATVAPAANNCVDAAEREAIRLYAQATAMQTEGAAPRAVLDVLGAAVRLVPHEPHLRYLAAGFAAHLGDLGQAEVHAEAAYVAEAGPRQRQIAFLCERISRARRIRSERRSLTAQVPDLLLVDV